jgi:cytidylate kinase
MNKKSIAIDGPSGAGKSTLAKALAAELGFLYVDTGAIYRTVGLYVYRKGADPRDEAAVSALFGEIEVDMTYGEDGLQHMLLNGEDVTKAIREHAISDYASMVSAHPSVRAFLLEKQRGFARKYDVIMDGRDIGTVVLPDADLKIFLTASVEMRAKRRHLELQQRGEQMEFEVVLSDMRQRDERDTNRAAAPLRQAEDAFLVDTTELALNESLKKLTELAKEKLFHEE